MTGLVLVKSCKGMYELEWAGGGGGGGGGECRGFSKMAAS